MRRIRIALLTLTAVLLTGWAASELGWLGNPNPGPPGGELPGNPAASRSAEDSSPAAYAADPSFAREAVPSDPDHRATGSLLIRVVDRASGKVVDGASITVDPSGPAGPRDAQVDRTANLRNPPEEPDAITNDLGEARIEVSSGIRMRLRVRDRGPEVGRTDRSILPLEPGERREIPIDLPRSLDLEHWIRAVAAPEEKPIGGASVSLVYAGATLPQAAGAPGDPDRRPVATDTEGLARLRVPSWRTALARIDAPGFGSRIAAVVPGHESPSSAQVLRLPRSASVSVLVTSSPGIPVADASLALTLPAPEIAVPRGTSVLAGDLVWSARTDEQGRCRIDDLPPEVPIRVEIRRGTELVRRLADPWILEPGERAERSVSLGGAARLFGMLLGPESKPMNGAEIWLVRVPAAPEGAPAEPVPAGSPGPGRYFWTGSLEQPFAKTRTDEAGSFTFEALETGDWWVGPSPIRAADDGSATDPIAPRAERVRISSGVAEVEVVLRATAGRWIRGSVVDPEDVAVAGTVVDARPIDALGSPSTRTSPDGSFALGPVAEGSFRVRARGRWGWTDSAEATARAGDRDVLLRLAPGATLRGRAIDRDTGAACVATIHLAPAGSSGAPGSDGSPARAEIASAGRDGVFEFRGLVPGTYDLLGRSDDGRMGFLDDVVVRPGEATSATVVAFSPAAKLRLRNGGKSAWGRYLVLRDGRVLAEGRWRAGASVRVDVPAGTVNVRFTPDGGIAEERTVQARADGQETEVLFSSD